MKSVNIQEAELQLSLLIQKASAGEEIIIAEAGRPVAKLVPYNLSREPRAPGNWRGKVRMAKDFDDTPEHIIADFNGEST